MVYHEVVPRECRVVAVSGFYYQLQLNEAAREEAGEAGLAELEAEARACLCGVWKPEDRKARLDAPTEYRLSSTMIGLDIYHTRYSGLTGGC